MKTIWKHRLGITDAQTITLPRGSIPLTVQTQGNEVQLWFIVPDSKTKKWDAWQIAIHGTGNPIDESRPPMAILQTYLGTFQANGGSFVGHVFGQKVS